MFTYMAEKPVTQFRVTRPQYRTQTRLSYKTRVSVDSTDAKLVEVIDEGKLIDSRTFVDRFGVTLYTSCLSTGCKAALLVNNIDDVVDLRECGINAISAYLQFFCFVAMGKMILSDGAEVAINIKGRTFTRVADAYKAMEEGLLW